MGKCMYREVEVGLGKLRYGKVEVKVWKVEVWGSGGMGKWRYGEVKVWESGGMGKWRYEEVEVGSGGMVYWSGDTGMCIKCGITSMSLGLDAKLLLLLYDNH